MFESMISGRDMHDDSVKPTDQFRGKFFKAQLIKDFAMAHKVCNLLSTNPDDKFLVIAGKGHLMHW